MPANGQGRLIIHAPNIHRGGGRTLLFPILEVAARRYQVVAFIDARLELPDDVQHALVVQRVPPNVPARLWAEWKLARTASAGDCVLCFGNMPPLFRCRGTVHVFVQNRYLVDSVSLAGLPWRIRARTRIERLWLSLFRSHAHRYIAQTHAMQRLVHARLGGRACTTTAVFSGKSGTYPRALSRQPRSIVGGFDFLYPASGDAHKNHATLFEAWKLLAAEGLYPVLRVTLSSPQDDKLCAVIERLTSRDGLRIVNAGFIPHSELCRLYTQVGALIYPSLLESFGLPLVEARQAGLPVLAAERDYVRELIDPDETFDPCSPLSISRAVKRHLRVVTEPLTLVTPEEFLENLAGPEGSHAGQNTRVP